MIRNTQSALWLQRTKECAGVMIFRAVILLGLMTGGCSIRASTGDEQDAHVATLTAAADTVAAFLRQERQGADIQFDPRPLIADAHGSGQVDRAVRDRPWREARERLDLPVGDLQRAAECTGVLSGLAVNPAEGQQRLEECRPLRNTLVFGLGTPRKGQAADVLVRAIVFGGGSYWEYDVVLDSTTAKVLDLRLLLAFME